MDYDLFFNRAIERLKLLTAYEKNDAKREFIEKILHDVQFGVISVDIAIEEAKSIGARNPSFDGDMIGWLDDDFTYDDPDEDDQP